MAGPNKKLREHHYVSLLLRDVLPIQIEKVKIGSIFK
jgi:hypothetical protein